jgi:uncharacterized protein YdeI (BOF family)
MKKLLLHFSLVIVAAVLAFAQPPSIHAQQAGHNPASAIPQEADAAAQQQNEAQMPASGDTATHEAQTFSGRIVKEKGELVLQDPVTKVTYKLDEPGKAKQYMDKQVKVTGKLDMDSNTIHVKGIEPVP